MDLKAVYDELGKLLAIDARMRLIPPAVPVGAIDSIDMGLTCAEAAQILNQRRTACEARLRALGFVAAHDSTAPTLREFRDREDRAAGSSPNFAGVLANPSNEQQRSAASLGFSD